MGSDNLHYIEVSLIELVRFICFKVSCTHVKVLVTSDLATKGCY